MADLSQPNSPLFNTAEDHLSRLLIEDVEEPWYKGFYRNIQDIIHPPKLPPLVVTSKPVAVKDIWGLYGRQKKSFMMSTGFQIGIVAVVFALSMTKPVQDAAKQVATLIMPLDIDPYQPKMAPQKKAMGGGGGG